jgi:hypothetical protein
MENWTSANGPNPSLRPAITGLCSPLRLRPGPVSWTAVFPTAPTKCEELIGHGDSPVVTALPSMRQPSEGTERERVEPWFHFCYGGGARAHQVTVEHLAAAEATGRRRSGSGWRRGPRQEDLGWGPDCRWLRNFAGKQWRRGACFTADDGDDRRFLSFYDDWKKLSKGRRCGFIVEEGPGKGSGPACTSSATRWWDVRGMPAALANRLDCSVV